MVVKDVVVELTTMFMNACLIDGGRMFIFSNFNFICIYMDDFCFNFFFLCFVKLYILQGRFKTSYVFF
jgi:hypothetical protein